MAAAPLGSAAAPTAPAKVFPNASPRLIEIPERNTDTEPANVARAKTYPSGIKVSGIEGPVKKVRVTLNDLEHEELASVDVLLVGPTGVKVILMGFTSQQYYEKATVTYTFDDLAARRLPRTNSLKEPPKSGIYQPTSYRNHADDPKFPEPKPKPDDPKFLPKPPYDRKLSAFNGTKPNGTWRLYVVDTLDRRGGAIRRGWDLAINGDGGSPPPADQCLGEEPTIIGSGRIDGTAGRDVIVGSRGDDEIHGRGGDDVLCGDMGADEIHGNAGNDRINGGSHRDKLFGESGDDLIHGSGDWDDLYGGADDDRVLGSSGNDTLRGGDGADALDGGPGKDRCEERTDPGDTHAACEATFG